MVQYSGLSTAGHLYHSEAWERQGGWAFTKIQREKLYEKDFSGEKGCLGKATNWNDWPGRESEHHLILTFDLQSPVANTHWPNPNRNQKASWSGDAVVMGQPSWILSKMEKGGRWVRRAQKKIFSTLTQSGGAMCDHQLCSWAMKRDISNSYSLTHSFNRNPISSPYYVKELDQFPGIQRNKTSFLPLQSCNGEIRQIGEW